MRLWELVERVVREYPLEEKVLVVDDYRDGNNLCEALARQGTPVVNLRPETVTGMARREAAEYLAEKEITLLTTAQTENLVELVYRRLQAEGRWEYFQGKGCLSGLMTTLTKAVLGLRCCGLAAAELSPRRFVNPAKGRDLGRLLTGYEEELHRHRRLDQPGLVSLALQLPVEKTAPPRLFLLPDFLKLYPRERALVEKLAGRHLILLPVRELSAKEPEINSCVEIFPAYGCENEAGEIMRRIATSSLPIDQVTVAYAGTGYPEIFYGWCGELGWRLTSAEGISASLTAPGKLWQGLVDWIGGDYQVDGLINLIQDGLLKLPEGMTTVEAAAILSGAGIGWSRERYRLLPEKEGSAGELSQLIDWVLRQIPTPKAEGEGSFRSYSQGLASILGRCSVTDGDEDQAALSGLLAALQECGQPEDLILPVVEILERLKRLLEGKRVAAGRPEPGKLYLASYRRLVWTDRPVTFVAGLDASFPGGGRQDPVLLDRECLQLYSALLRTDERLRRERLLMELGLATRRGRLTLSYSSHDPATGQELYPAAVLLEVFRLLKGDPSLDYTAFQQAYPVPVGFAPSPGEFPINEAEWWLGAAEGTSKEAVRSSYPGIARGMAAEEAKRELTPTCYDGRIEADPQILDPRLNGEVVSCSALELLGRCPFAFFLRYRLKIKPPEELSYDPSSWLPANERGSLLHTLYCRWLRRIARRGGRPAAEDGDRLRQMADQLIAAYRERIPVPSELIFDREVDEIHRSGTLFFQLECESVATPLYLEVPFGLGKSGIRAAGLGTAGPVELDLGENRRLKLAGRIDRIDRSGEGYAVWDYKSGSSYHFDESKPLGGGRRLQHALYAVAAEKILAGRLGGGPRVTSTGYLFPTAKGEGVRVTYQVSRERVQELVNLLCDLIGKGLYLYTDEADDCTFCEYIPVCRGKGAARGKELRSNEAEPSVVPLRRLRNYD